MRNQFSIRACLLATCVLSFSSIADTVFYDGFEDDDASDWSVSGNVTTSGTQSIGNYALRLKKTASALYQIDTSGYSNITVEMQMAATALEAADGDTCYAEVSSDGGSNWTALVTLVDGQDNATFHYGSFTDSSLDDNANVQVRFRGTNDDLGDYCWGDEVLVTGTLGGLTPAPEISISGNLNFGSQQIQTTSTKQLTITNIGDADLQMGQTSALSSPFVVTSDACSNNTVNSNNSCFIEVSFTPTTATYASDTLTLVSNDPDNPNVSLTATGTGTESGGGPTDNFDPLSGNGNVTRNELTYTYLNSATSGAIVDMSAFALPANAAQPTNTFEGRLVLTGEATNGSFNEIKDTFRYTSNQDSTRKHLPEFDYEFVQTGTHLVPVERGMLSNSHPEWEYILEPGRVWNENGDNGYSRAAIPFSLQQKNANCIHNGVLSFAFKDDGSVTQVAYQIASETCLYFKFDMWGILAASYTPYGVPDAATIAASHQADVNNRLPTKAISELANDYPGTDVSKFSSSVTASHMSVFGLYINGTNYVGGCETRHGTYPYCDVLRVPSYSTAKSNFAGVAMMRLEQKYGNVMAQTIDTHITDCANDGNWDDVTLEHAVDMATGNYGLAGYMSDEGASHTNDLFLPEDHSSKISYSCTEYNRKATPGTKWVYHTSDTYIAGTAMNAIVKQHEGSQADIFTDVIVNELWKPLKVSQSTLATRRTYDGTAQPFTGWGLAYNADDTVKIAKFLSIDNGLINGTPMLDAVELDAALQRTPSDRGLSPSSGLFYKNGFWAKDLSAETSCSDMWVPFMSGYGGITIALLPNGTIYYYFSDNDEFSWADAATESHNIQSFCGN